eukprot:GHUV01004738.1.p1 GENE.GHUV01004738.1~~GHUV01004738.1.p1  ORF type:complete len:307 (+),score=64.64 GHUV01004738.1:492-1412(+)
MAFFATRSVADESSLLGSLRVAVVGEPSVGKTALAELIASGQPAKGGIRSTAGAHIYVKLVERAQHQQDPGNEAQKRFFVELWDVSGQKKYEQLRSVFYKQLNGVILVYDLNNKASLNCLPRWAAEIASKGSFVAPVAEEVAARNIGRLPVPVLVIGNKADRLKHGTADASSLSSMVNHACSQVLSSSTCSSWWRRSVSGIRGHRRAPSETNITADVDQHMKGLTASAATGQIDLDLLNSFFAALWERRYKPVTGGSMAQEYMNRIPSYSGFGVNLANATAALKGPSGLGNSSDTDGNQRLDDDWV